jgi:hypothetical protein
MKLCSNLVIVHSILSLIVYFYDLQISLLAAQTLCKKSALSHPTDVIVYIVQQKSSA